MPLWHSQCSWEASVETVIVEKQHTVAEGPHPAWWNQALVSLSHRCVTVNGGGKADKALGTRYTHVRGIRGSTLEHS